jgi:hypothetical protein
VPHPPDVFFEFLSDLRNHWRLEPHFLELEDVGAESGRVRVGAPLGLSRVARTRVVGTERPSLVRGSAEIGRGTRGAVRWEIADASSASDVRFTAVVEQATILDRLMLACGGRWWLRRIAAAAVRRLPDALAEH